MSLEQHEEIVKKIQDVIEFFDGHWLKYGVPLCDALKNISPEVQAISQWSYYDNKAIYGTTSVVIVTPEENEMTIECDLLVTPWRCEHWQWLKAINQQLS